MIRFNWKWKGMFRFRSDYLRHTLDICENVLSQKGLETLGLILYHWKATTKIQKLYWCHYWYWQVWKYRNTGYGQKSYFVHPHQLLMLFLHSFSELKVSDQFGVTLKVKEEDQTLKWMLKLNPQRNWGTPMLEWAQQLNLWVAPSKKCVDIPSSPGRKMTVPVKLEWRIGLLWVLSSTSWSVFDFTCLVNLV